MRTSYQGSSDPARGRTATLGVAAMLLLAGILAAVLGGPGVVAQAGTPPSLTSATFLDTDADGYLDAVEVTFDTAMNASTVRPSDFTVEIGSQKIVPHGCDVTAAAPFTCDESTFRLYFQEPDTLNTGLVPDLLYAGGAQDTDGDEAASVDSDGLAGADEETEATPYFLRAYGSTGSKQALYWFTEPVQMQPPGQTGVVFPQDPEDAFCWAKGGDPLAEGNPIIDDAVFSDDPEVPTATVTLSTLPASGDRATIYRAALGVTGSQNGGCNTDSNTLIVDSDAGISVPNYKNLSEFNAPITLLGAYGSVGSDKLVLAFDGPVEAPNGGAITKSIADTAFDYNDNGGGASSFSAVKHAPNSSRITLTLNRPLVLADLQGTDPDTITATAGGLIGAGSKDIGPINLAATTISLTGVGVESTAPTTSAGNITWQSIDLSPRVVEAVTTDLDSNDLIDAIRVRFDQPVFVSGTESPTFSVQNLSASAPATVSKIIDSDDTDNTCLGTVVVAPSPHELWLCIDEHNQYDSNTTPTIGFSGIGIEDSFGNVAVPFGGLEAKDGAEHLEIVEVRTRDYFDFGASGTATANAPRAANGLIDTLELFFDTQKIDDGYDGSTCTNLEPAEWGIQVGSTVVTPTFMETYVPALRERPVSGWVAGQCQDPTGTSRDSNTVYLIFDEDEDWHTGVKPEVSHLGDDYLGDGGDGHTLVGLQANRFNVTTVPDSKVLDKASPIILEASASVGFDQVSITFSEEVRGASASGAARALQASDLKYVDNNQGDSSGFDGITQANAGSRTILVSTNVKPARDDLGVGGDAVRPAYDTALSPQSHPAGSTIRDLAGNKIVYLNFTTSNSGVAIETPIEDNEAPIVLEQDAQDANGDGFMDSIKLRFNKPVKGSGSNSDSSACPDPALWDITIDGKEVDAIRVTDEETLGTDCSGSLSQDWYVEFDGFDDTANGVRAHSGSTVRFNYTLPELGESAVVDTNGNGLIPMVNQKAKDRAAPVLLTLDCKPTPPGTDAQAETVDDDGDGRVNALRVCFSEPVDLTSFKANDWKVDGGGGLLSTTNPPVQDGAFVKIFLQVPTGTGPNTNATPTLTYEPQSTSGGLKDLVTSNPNRLDAERYKGTNAELVTLDGAPPAILASGSGLDGKNLTLAFSEPVYNKQPSGTPVAADSIGVGDVAYDNKNARDSGDRSKDIQSVAHNATSATQAHVVEMEFDAVPSQDDKDKDFVDLDAVFDAAGNPASATRTSLTGVGDDTEPPAKITQFTATAVAREDGNNITLTWTSPAPDSLRGDDLESLVITINEVDDGKDPEDITESTVSDPATPPDPVAGLEQNLTIGNVTSGKTYEFTILAIDEAGLQGRESQEVQVEVPFLDTNDPGLITDLEVESTTGSSVTLKWTAPADLDGEDNPIKVAGYQIRNATSTFASFSDGEAATFTLDPASIAAAGQVQRATVTGLEAETTYHFAVRAMDARPNFGGFDTVQATTGQEDTTPPTGTLTIVSSTHPEATAVDNDAPTFAWSGLTDPDTPIIYHYALNKQSGYEVTGEEAQTDRTGSTTALSKGFTGVADGTWHFHVRGFSQGGSSDTATYTIIILDPDSVIDPAVIAAANTALQANVTVEREDGNNTVRWTLPETDEDVAGVQIWRSTSPFELLVDLDADAPEFAAGAYVDEGAPAGARYIVTLYFSEDPTGGQVEDLAQAPGYGDLTEAELAARGTPAVLLNPPDDPTGDGGLPAWLWILIAVGLVGIVAAVVVPVVMSRRGRSGDGSGGWDEGAWAAGDAGPPDAASGEAHFIECPKCQHGFEVHGERPLETTCPNCGVKGVLN